MSINRRAGRLVKIAATIAATMGMIRCGGSPTGGSTTPTVSAVTLSSTSLSAGSSGQGTVSLSAPAATGGASIALSSSNPSVVTVQTPVTIPEGSSSVSFTVTAVTTGTAIVTASLNGSNRQSPVLTVTTVAVASISLSAPSVVGGDFVTGTVTLTAAAPPGGAVVSLSAGDPITVNASVTVPAGASSAPFTITTRAVGGTISGTITAAYGGVSKSAALSVTKPTIATASFGITGPTETETCELANAGTTLNCTFNGSTSTAPGTIIAWDWSFRVAATFTQTTSGPVLAMPTINCSLLPPPPLPAGMTWFTMAVTLKVRDNVGNVSAEVTHNGTRLFPQGACGY